MFDRHQTVASVVLASPACAEVFQGHRIDFSCRGELSVEAAALQKGLGVVQLLGELAAATVERRREGPDVRQLSTPELVSFTRSHHHEPLKRTLPFVSALASKVSRVHGAHAPNLVRLESRVAELCISLGTHLEDEAELLFPALVAGHVDGKARALFEAAFNDHLAVVERLEEIRAAACDFVAPPSACNSYRTLFAELKWLELDVLSLIHLENYVLRGRVAAVVGGAA